jgi:hypothetical protein
MGYLGRTPTPSPIDTSDIPANSIDASKIIDGAIAVADVADNAITEAKIADAAVVSLKSGRKNLIINGGMQVAQRGTGAFTAANSFPVDRWAQISNTTDFTTTQSSIVPTGKGFNSSIKVQPTVIKTSSTSTYARIGYKIEGYDGAGLCWGTSGAKSATISFWVRASVAGIYSITPKNGAANRSICLEYTIDSVDTWEYKTVTVPAVTDGTWDKTTGNFCYIDFWQAGLAGGTSTIGSWVSSNVNMSNNQVNLFASTSNTFYITGVQLELGSVATDFEHRSYGEELALCQRYYWRSEPVFRIPLSTNLNGGNDYNFCYIQHPVEMRVAPTIGYKDGDNNATKFSYHSSSYWSNRINNLSQYHALLSSTGVRLVCNPYTGFDAFIKDFTADAEL